jgi:endogenous inhibitor of DNA gyrase (YacG/DUF329 family)
MARAMLCPICKRPVEQQPENHDRRRSSFPFCSDRCKLIDLGRWLGGKYQIPLVDRDVCDVNADTMTEEDAPAADRSRRNPRR